MKKSIVVKILAASLCLAMVSLPGCGDSGQVPDNTDVGTEESSDTDQKAESENDDSDVFKENELDTSSENQSEVSQDTDEKPTFMATVYYADDQTAEITWKDVEVSNEYEVWEALKETGILTDDCELLSLKVNEDENTLDLDFNSATGDRIRSMGTAGETEIIGCIINTYLETYSANGIKLTEEGQLLETSHGADMSGYNGIVSF